MPWTETTEAKASISPKDAERAPQPQEKAKEKFFVVKSLTVEDLERSVHCGVWATQAHNEVALSKAYKVAYPPSPKYSRPFLLH